jgi:precorrin-2 methylase
MAKATLKKTEGPGPAGEQPPQVLICGLGLRLPGITLETMQALKNCGAVFHDFLDARTEKQLSVLCPGIRDLRKLCRTAAPDEAAGVILAAAGPGRTVAFLRCGHPVLFQEDALVRLCRAGRIPYRVMAGVSSLDEIMVAIGTPILKDGLQLYAVSRTARRLPLRPAAPAVILSLDRLWEPAAAGVHGFVAQLGGVYPPGHRMLLVHCPDSLDASALRVETDLAGLAGALKKLKKAARGSASLYIPTTENSKKSPPRAPAAAAEMNRGKQLFICGLGLRLLHMTAETLQTLKKCRTVFHDFLDEKAANYVRTLCPDLRDLRKLRRRDDSEANADEVMPALAKGRSAAFLGYGHPMVLQGTAEVLIRRCREAGVEHRVTASVSALDEIFIAAGAPIPCDGLQLCPSDVVISRAVPLDPGVPAIIMLLNHLWDFPQASVAGLVKHLKTIYPPEHRMLLIRCSRIVGDPLLRIETPLKGLASALKNLPEKERFNTSMFLPALRQAK